MISVKRILVPTDFSDCALPAVRYAAELADKFAAELILLHVVPDTVLALPDAVPGVVDIWEPIKPQPKREIEAWDAPFDALTETSPQVRLATKIDAQPWAIR